jgi:hypothetical protein
MASRSPVFIFIYKIIERYLCMDQKERVGE